MRPIIIALGLFVGSSFVGCGEAEQVEESVDFESEGVLTVRQNACAADYENGARKGAGAEDHNASTLWSVSPYLVLVPSTGQGHVKLNVDAPHFDWLIYVDSAATLESAGGPQIMFNGPLESCPELDLVEYGVHHDQRVEWPLLLDGEPLSRATFYAGLVATEHSDPEDAGHAGHLVGEAPSHEEH